MLTHVFPPPHTSDLFRSQQQGTCMDGWMEGLVYYDYDITIQISLSLYPFGSLATYGGECRYNQPTSSLSVILSSMAW